MSESHTDRKTNDGDLLAKAIPISQSDSGPGADDQSQAGSRGSDDGPDALQIDAEPIELEVDVESDDDPSASASGRSIRAFGAGTRHEEQWNRSPNTPGTGAIHVRTFVAKLRLDAIEHMDEQVNQWLDAHPQYEVKFVTKSVGTLKGKKDEEALFLSVWV